MIEPVRPIGLSVLTTPPAVFAICRRLGWDHLRAKALWIPWARLPLAVVMEFQQAESAAAAASPDRLQQAPPSEGSHPAEPWKPWSAEPPFVQRVGRWWPSDDFPPDEPQAVIEDRVPDVPPDIVEWYTRGGLLDYWA